MLWQVTMHSAGAETLDRTLVVEADNWYQALRKYLSRAATGEKLIASITSTVQSDGTVQVVDIVTQKRFSLAPRAALEEDGGGICDESPSPTSLKTPETPSAIPCELVFEREEPPAQATGIRYIEHHYVAPGPLPRETARSVVLAKFSDLRTQGAGNGEKLFINIQLFDDAAEESNRSPRAYLSWKEWEDEEPATRFLEDDTDSKIALLSSNQVSTMSDHDKKSPSRVEHPQTEDTETHIDELVVTAFERMQELFHIREHRPAATFALSLGRELSSCEGGVCLLERTGNAPAEVHKEGAAEEPPPIKQELTLNRGIVGFATRNGAAIHVVDPQHDPRCADDLDLAGGRPPRNLLCVPLQHEGHTIGALLFWDAPGDAGFSRDSINALSYIAGALAEHIAVSLPARDGKYFADDAPAQRRSKPPSRISLIPLPFFNKLNS